VARFSPQVMESMGISRFTGEKPAAVTPSAQEQAAQVANVNTGRKVAGKLGNVDDRISSVISLPIALAIAATVYAYMRWGD